MKIIIPIIVGAIIGYFTNWLAIKMLFRPYYRKKILGMNVPFTPGLIPKEKDRIAESIGETVGEYLLSPDTIIEALSDKEIDNAIKSWIYNKIGRMRENHQSISEFLENILGDNYTKFIKRIEDKLRDLIIKQIRKNEFKNLIYEFITEKINNVECESIYNILNKKLRKFMVELPNSYKLKSEIIVLMKSKLTHLSDDERKISELLPEGIIPSIYNYIDENENDIGNSIRNRFKDPIIQEKLKNSISELVYKNISKIIIAFVGPDIIAEKIFYMMEKYINSEDTNKDIVMFIKSLLDRLLRSKVSEIGPKLSDIIEEEEFEKIADILIGYIGNEDNYNILLNIVKEKLSITELKNKEFILSYLTNKIDKILESNELEKSIDLFIRNIKEDFLNKSIGLMLVELDEATILGFYKTLRNIFDKLAIYQLPKMIEFFNISKIVEEKIQSFDVSFTEKLILEIASKELKAITWLGALLGGMMGILTPLLQMMY